MGWFKHFTSYSPNCSSSYFSYSYFVMLWARCTTQIRLNKSSLTPSPSSCQNTSKCQSALHQTNVELCRNWVNFATSNRPASDL